MKFFENSIRNSMVTCSVLRKVRTFEIDLKNE